MSTRVILADALDPRINQVRAICEDWARAGLTRESVWLDINSEMYEATFLSSQGRESLPTAEWLAELPPGEDIRILVLQPIFEGTSPYSIPFLQDKLRQFDLLSSAFGESINLVCPFEASENLPTEIIHESRLNLIAIPSDAISPGAAEIVIREDSPEVYSHIALNLCSAVSLWVGVNEKSNSLIGEMRNIQFQKTFLRYVDASELVDEIVLAVLGEASGSVSRVYDTNGVEYDSLNEVSAQGAMKILAKNFIERNKALLGLSPEEPYTAEDKVRRGLWETIKIFFEFLFSYLRKAPGLWAREKIASLSKKVASKANSFFWGDESANEIVVNGISGATVKPIQDDSPETSTEKSPAEQLLDISAAYLQKETNKFPAPTSPRDIWRDFTEICLGLLDGQGTRLDYPMPQVDGSQNSLVLDKPELVVAATSSTNFAVAANLPITMSGVILSFRDPYMALLARQQIIDAMLLQNSPAVQAELEEQRNLLEQWIKQNSSFVWNVGLRIANNLNDARLRLRKLSMGITTKFSESRLQEAEANARRSLFNMIKVSLGIFLTTLGLAFTPLFPLLPVMLVGAVVLLVWNVIGGILFNRAIRDYFKVSHQVDEEGRKHDHDMAQKLKFANDAQRLASVYLQYQAWAKLLSETIYRPFGEESQNSAGRVSPIRMLTDLTRSVHVGRLATNASDKDALVAGVKKRFFSKGWRHTNFSRLLEALGADPKEIFSDVGVGNNSVLARVSRIYDPSSARESLLEEAAKSARQLALDSADYGHWPVSAVAGTKDAGGSTCLKFLTPLLASEKIMKTTFLKPAESGTANAVHSDGAQVFMDRRIDFGSLERVAVQSLDGDQLTDYQQLDYMAVRIERSELFGYTSLALLEKTTEEIAREERLSQKTFDEPDEVEG